MDYEQVIKQLIHDFGPTDIYTRKDSSGSDNILHIGTTFWNGTPQILRIDLRLEGCQPMDGKTINQVFDYLTGGRKAVELGVNKLHGEYTIHFDAIFTDQSRQADALPAIKQMIVNPASQPVIVWSISNGKAGWTKVTVNVNCPERVNGKLWLKAGTMQQLPKLTDNQLVCYVPFDCSKAVLICKNGTGIAINKKQ